jgi:hypothetical protein
LRRWGDVFRARTPRWFGFGALAWTVLALAYVGTRSFGTEDRLSATYWTNAEWSGAPALTRTEGAVETDREWLERLLGESPGYSAEWSGVLHAAGEYRFTITPMTGRGS